MPILFEQGPRLRDEEFRLIRDQINAFCGILFADESRFIVERRDRKSVV